MKNTLTPALGAENVIFLLMNGQSDICKHNFNIINYVHRQYKCANIGFWKIEFKNVEVIRLLEKSLQLLMTHFNTPWR